MRLLLCVEVVCGAPEFVVWVIGLESREFVGRDARVVWERPGKPSMRVVVFNAVTMRSAAGR